MPRARKAPAGHVVRWLRGFSPGLYFKLFRKSVYSAIEHDCLTVAQATAYSAMVALFPALIVSAAIVALLPGTVPFRFQMAMFFDRILPSNVSPLLDAYFATGSKSPHTVSALIGALVVSVTGAASVMATWMEGFRRAHNLPLEGTGFWRRRGRALLLVPLSLLPMAAASALVVFGHFLTQWMAHQFAPEARAPFYIAAFLLRWSVTLAGSVGIIAVIYHLGTDVSKHMREHMGPFLGLRMDWSWRRSLPGATLATAMWFLSTLVFGLYVTRFANYSQVYGSLGAAIALMFWLYIIALSVLCGAEFNAQLAAARRSGDEVAVPAKAPEVA
ncbi:MAG: YihY/virulence factor BrkB family protein [Acidobacteriaceae bacterium]